MSVDFAALCVLVNTAMVIGMKGRGSVLCPCHSVPINTVCDIHNVCTLLVT